VRPERDVVIVGMGASGGLLASLLTDAGLEVVGLEAGERHGVDEFTLEDAGQLTRNELGAAKVNHEIPTVRSSREEQAAPASATYGLLIMNGVGGSKLHSTNISWRLLPWNLQAYSGTVARFCVTHGIQQQIGDLAHRGDHHHHGALLLFRRCQARRNPHPLGAAYAGAAELHYQNILQTISFPLVTRARTILRIASSTSSIPMPEESK